MAVIQAHLLRDLSMPRKTKQALAKGVCPGCEKELVVIDTWERTCPHKGCGYTFNHYHWAWVAAPMPPEDPGPSTEPR